MVVGESSQNGASMETDNESPCLLQADHTTPLSDYGLRATASFLSRSTQGYYVSSNQTDSDVFSSKLRPAADVSIDGVLAALAFNVIVFGVLVILYEVLRRLLPSVYAARRRHVVARPSLVSSLPDGESYVPLDWVAPVFGVPWSRVRDIAGLDAYFFLRFIRMCLRITSVTAFWGMVILFPVYGHGGGNAAGWYHFSMANISQASWRMWVPTVFMYLFSSFTFFVMKQEYRHYLELRMDFLGGREEANVNPQHHYSLMVERIPYDLRSDAAMFDYFNSLFPGKVHSASVVLNVPDLETLSARRVRVIQRLEKSIAIYEATGERPTHVVGRPRLMCCGIESTTLDCCACGKFNPQEDDQELPSRGERVDSITYYARDLATCNKQVFILQNRKNRVAETGNASIRASNWLTKAVNLATEAAIQVMDESMHDNGLLTAPDSSGLDVTAGVPQAEKMSGMRFGSYSPHDGTPLSGSRKKKLLPEATDDGGGGKQSFRAADIVSWDASEESDYNTDFGRESRFRPYHDESARRDEFMDITAANKCQRFLRRLAGRLGLDFVFSGFKFFNRQLDTVVDSVVGTTMSSTGFVTFLEHAAVTCASSAPLTHKPGILEVMVAPEPRDIRWENAHIDRKVGEGKELTANVLLCLGAILWSIPLTAIQAFATAESLAQIKGMEWILTFDGGSLTAFINGYLPVLALLGLILLLPIIFEAIAVKYENRKTYSDVQQSIVGRYFYYQLTNIYVTVTAGSVWSSLAEIYDHPSDILEILGNSLPKVVGYFISLLITKILAGLPMIILRFGALMRMLFLRSCFSERKLTQRELDEIYRPDPLLYGWEYPTQLLVIIIVFTYACISPIILPVGAVYFLGALMVYKKQAMYVYTPVYEAGGSLFPVACNRTLFGLICAQITFIGYIVIREGFEQQFVLIPLPFLTLWVMNYFRRHYAEPSKRLSMERAMELDRLAKLRAPVGAAETGSVAFATTGAERLMETFDKNAYRQPVLSEGAKEPRPYRRGQEDSIAREIRAEFEGGIQSNNRYQFMTEKGNICVINEEATNEDDSEDNRDPSPPPPPPSPGVV